MSQQSGSSEDEYYDDVFDEASSNLETEGSDLDDSSSDCSLNGLGVDLDDQAQLFDGNARPPEYYLQAIENFNDEDYDMQDYSDNTLRSMDGINEGWQQ